VLILKDFFEDAPATLSFSTLNVMTFARLYFLSLILFFLVFRLVFFLVNDPDRGGGRHRQIVSARTVSRLGSFLVRQTRSYTHYYYYYYNYIYPGEEENKR